jgi:hypothetical protein
MLPSNYTAGTVSDLIADMNAANAAGGSNTITLVAGTTFTLSAVDNTFLGATGLPFIATNDNLTIVGNGDVIQRSTATGTPLFNLMDVASGGSLTLQNLTLQGGASTGNLGGGAIQNYLGTLTLSGVTIQNNKAFTSGGVAKGGGIFSYGGALTMQNCTVRNNQVIGSDGPAGQSGADAYGGGIYIVGGTASLSNVTLSSNTAQGGNGGPTATGNGGKPESGKGPVVHHSGAGNGGNGLGGGMFVASGTVTLLNTSMSANTATGGLSGGQQASGGLGEGGGLYIDAVASVCLDAFTQAHVTNNTTSTSYPNIDGPWQPC